MLEEENAASVQVNIFNKLIVLHSAVIAVDHFESKWGQKERDRT